MILHKSQLLYIYYRQESTFKDTLKIPYLLIYCKYIDMSH